MKKFTTAALFLLLILSTTSNADCAQTQSNLITQPSGATQKKVVQLKPNKKIVKATPKQVQSPTKIEPAKVVSTEASPALDRPVAKNTSKEATPALDKPVAKPKGKSYLPPVPVSKNYMQAPYAANYKFIGKTNYSLHIPNAFGSDPLANLPGTDGPMLVRIKDNATYMAVTVIDPTDTVSYKATEPLPRFSNKKLDMTWLMGTKEVLKCSAGSYSGFYGDIMVIEASQETKGRTYELLFSFPAKDIYTYLPHVLYSLYTFQVK